MSDRIVLKINPQAYLKVLPSWALFFRIPENCFYLEEEGRWMTKEEKLACEYHPVGCSEFSATGKCKHTLRDQGLQIKRRVEKYNRYKDDLLTLAKRAEFVLPAFGWSVYFYHRVPGYWSKKKKLRMHGQMKMSKPDTSNLLKAFEDALTITDEKVAQLSGIGKFWVNEPQGYIEIKINQPLYNPYSVDFADQDTMMQEPKRRYVKHGSSIGRYARKKQKRLFKNDNNLL